MRCPSGSFTYCPTHFIALAIAFTLILSPAGLSGMAATQSVSLSTMRQSVTFPPTAVGLTSSPVTVPLLVGSDGITINAISAQPSAGGLHEYAVQSIGCALNTTLSAGTACNIGVTFTPGYPGERPVPLLVATSAGNFNFGMEGLGLGPQVALTPAVINTVAGNGSFTLSGDGAPAIDAGVPVPLATALDSTGDVYIVDAVDSTVRKIAANTSIISTVAGSNGFQGFAGDGGPAIHASLDTPLSVALDSAGNVYIADSTNSFVRKVTVATGIISTFVGTGHFFGHPPMPPAGYAGDGGLARIAKLNSPAGLAFDSADNLYIADSGNNVIRRVDGATQIITTVAGNHKSGYSGDSGPAASAELHDPNGVVVDNAENLFIADQGNHVIRKVAAATGIITTVAGTGTPGYSGDGGPATAAELHNPAGVSVDTAGNLYIVDSNNSRIREVSAISGVITTVAGTGVAAFGGDGHSASAAELNYPNDVSLDSFGNLYIADSLNNRIRRINVLASELYFATTPIGFTSLDSPQTATVSNIGNAPLVFSVPASGLNPNVSPNFTLSNGGSCPQLDIGSSSESLPPGRSCSLLLNFVPIQTGPISGTANIADNAVSAPPFVQTVHLNAIGLPASAGRPDFTLSVTPSNQTTSSTSAPAVYTVTVTGIYGFSGNVALVATGVPSSATASFAPASVAVSGANASSTFTITVLRTQAKSMPDENRFPGDGSALQYGLLLLSFPLLGIARRRKQLRSAGGTLLFTVLMLASLAAAVTGCANIGLELQPQTYNIVIDGTSNNLQRSTTLTLTVKSYVKVRYH